MTFKRALTSRPREKVRGKMGLESGELEDYQRTISLYKYLDASGSDDFRWQTIVPSSAKRTVDRV